MVRDLSSIGLREKRTLRIEAGALDMLLFDFLQDLIFYKDAQGLLLRVERISILCQEPFFSLNADALGEKIDPRKHELLADVKAVTLHRFEVKKTEDGWRTNVILDI